MPKPKYQSRAKRASTQADQWRGVAEQLHELFAENNPDDHATEEGAEPLFRSEAEKEMFYADIVKQANSVLESLDISELEALTEEMTSWRDNMQGTSLENTGKFSTVDEAASTLENIDTDTPEITSFDEIEEVADELENRADELDGVEFPGMFG